MPGDGPARGSRTLHAALELFEKHDIRAELAMTGIFAQQLADDFPEDIERIKQMKFPITRYPGVGHAEPNPVGRGHIELRDLRRSGGITSFSDEVVAVWWDWETRTLVPGWHLKDGQLVLGNLEENRPIQRQELGDYHLPDKAEYLFGGTMAIQKIFGVTPLPTFPPLFEGEGFTRQPDPVQRALGMRSFEISVTPAPSGLPILAPAQQSARWKQGVPPKYYGKKLGEAPYMADTVTWLTLLAQNQPRHRPYRTQLYLTSGTQIWEGGTHRDGFVEILEFVASHSEDFQFVWQDPDAWQWKSENSPEAFFEKTYGKSSLEEMLGLKAPIQKIRQSARPRRGSGGRGRNTSGDAEGIPDYLNPVETTISQADLLSAADQLLTQWPRGDHDGNFGGPPPYVEAGDKNLTLSETFQGFLISLQEYAESREVLEKVVIRELVGPIKYPQVDLAEEPKRDPDKLIGGYLAEELDPKHFPSPETVFAQGLPPAGGGLNIVWPVCTTADVEDFFYSVREAHREMQSDGHIPSGIPMYFLEENSFGKRHTEKIRAIVNPAEFLYGLAQQYRLIAKHGKPGDVMMVSMNVIAHQKGQFIMPAYPASFEGGMKVYQKTNGIIWRHKVPDWAIHNAWNYKLGSD
ncbi:MAG: hypothetical protein QGG64_07025 [Candidatus Latescibacteria bacterium]|nr:hypothetical protein [Candidatus Latescibacterota bacterium]